MATTPEITEAANRLGRLIREAKSLPEGPILTPGQFPGMKIGMVYNASMTARLKQAILDIAPYSEYAKVLDKIDSTEDMYNMASDLKSDLDKGTASKLYMLAHADVFNDYLESAEHLLKKHYVIAAAITAGVTCESHIRRLAGKHGLALSKANGESVSASDLNNKLYKDKQVYDLATQKQIDTWQAIRNQAAHGQIRFEDQAQREPEVKAMILGLKIFIAANPA